MNITEELSKFITDITFEDLPKDVVHEGKRSLINIIGVAVGACRHESIDIVLDLAREINAVPTTAIWGRTEKADILFASLINGMASHMFDFDDTHLATIMHPSAPVAPAAFAVGEERNLKCSDVLLSFILGIEAECRISNAVSPRHLEQGFHLTGTVGHLGAAIAAGKSYGLRSSQLSQAIGLAATQASGIVDMLGTMSKPFHPGHAAMDGIMAAKLISRGFTSSSQVLESRKGFAYVFTPESDISKILQNIGREYEILKNSYKPFACGIVAHPAIDAAIRIKNKHKITASQVKFINCIVHPFVPVPMGKKYPKTGLEGKFSTYHCVAVGLIDGTAGEVQFSDARVNDPEIVNLRHKVKLTTNGNIEKDEAVLEVELNDGKIITEHVKNCIGSIGSPMTDQDLSKKFQEVASITMPMPKVNELLDTLWNFENVPDMARVIEKIRA